MTHKLVGYDRHTERVAFECDVPNYLLETTKQFALVPADDGGATGNYPLTKTKVFELIRRYDLDYFLEPVGAKQ